MRLKSFEIKSYRSCIDTEISLDRHLTTLIGSNGSGKSNLLNAILLLKQVSNFAKRGRPHKEDVSLNVCRIEAVLEFREKPIILKGKIAFETDEDSNERILNVDLRWDLSYFISYKKLINYPLNLLDFGNHFDQFLESKNSNRERVATEYFNFFGQKDFSLDLFRETTPFIDRVIKYLNSISYYSASQFADPSLCPNFIELEDEKPIRTFRSSRNHYKFITDLYQSWKEKDKPNFQKYVSTVNKLGIGLVDDVIFEPVQIPSSSVKVLSGGKYKKIERNRTLIIPNFIIDNNQLSPNQLSEGTFRTLALVYYLLTDTSDLLIIEEPEVCVHHGLLNSIMSLIKTQSKSKQIIISTHSDFVLDQLNPSNVVLVTKAPQQGTKAKALTKYFSKNEFKSLKKYLEESGNLGEYWKETGF
jgi:AAA15 family ATPase/GTPase